VLPVDGLCRVEQGRGRGTTARWTFPVDQSDQPQWSTLPFRPEQLRRKQILSVRICNATLMKAQFATQQREGEGVSCQENLRASRLSEKLASTSRRAGVYILAESQG
jgi:hypothetical protein